MGKVAKPSYELDTGTHVVTQNPGALSFASIITDGSNDVTVSFYDCNSAGEIDSSNKLNVFKVDASISGFQGGGNIISPLRFSTGLVVVVAGTNGKAYIGFIK